MIRMKAPKGAFLTPVASCSGRFSHLSRNLRAQHRRHPLSLPCHRGRFSENAPRGKKRTPKLQGNENQQQPDLRPRPGVLGPRRGLLSSAQGRGVSRMLKELPGILAADASSKAWMRAWSVSAIASRPTSLRKLQTPMCTHAISMTHPPAMALENCCT